MIQNLRTYRSLIVTAADTVATRFASQPVRAVLIRSRTGNTGSFKILGVNGITIDSDGYTIATGTAMPVLWMDNLDQIAYKAENANDVLEILYGV